MSSAIYQLSCFSSVSRRLQLQTRSRSCLPLRPKVLVVMSQDARGTEISSSETSSSLSYSTDASTPSTLHNGTSIKSYPTTETHSSGEEKIEPLQEDVVTEPTRAAKIHDFCFGIPFGGLVFSGGLLGFIFTRNPATLISGVLFGAALLALSTFSLKVWRQGKSSLPFILGQAGLAAMLLWKNFQSYSLTKKIFPTGVNAFISAAMLSFYFYVVISGGNPPPKKKSSEAVPLL